MKANFNLAGLFAGTAALAIVGAMPAFAADAIYEQPPAPAPIEVIPSASTGWAGPYVGIQGGYNWGETNTDLPGVGSRDHNGWLGSVFAGVQGQNGSIVYGVEGDVGYDSSEGFDGITATQSGIDGSLRARLGYAPNDRFMIYATGGGAAQSLEASDAIASDKNTMLGYTIGAGAEAKVTENVFVRGEYRFSDYGSETFNLGAGPQEIDLQTNKVQIGLGIKF